MCQLLEEHEAFYVAKFPKVLQKSTCSEQYFAIKLVLISTTFKAENLQSPIMGSSDMKLRPKSREASLMCAVLPYSELAQIKATNLCKE